MISGYTVPWVAAEHPQGWEAALKWIDSDQEKIQVSGWNTLAAIVDGGPCPPYEMPMSASVNSGRYGIFRSASASAAPAFRSSTEIASSTFPPCFSTASIALMIDPPLVTTS